MPGQTLKKRSDGPDSAAKRQRVNPGADAPLASTVKNGRSLRQRQPKYKGGTTGQGFPFVPNEQFASGSSTGLSPLAAAHDNVSTLFDAQTPQKLSDEDNEELLALAERAKKDGNSFIHSEVDDLGRNKRTIGRYDVDTGRSGRGVTPDAPGMVAHDDRGHGFPQSNVVNGDKADQVKHMYPENWMANQGTTRAVELHGEKLANKDRSREVFKERVAHYDGTEERPKGFTEKLLRRTDSGDNFELVAALVQNNPQLERNGTTVTGTPWDGKS